MSQGFAAAEIGEFLRSLRTERRLSPNTSAARALSASTLRFRAESSSVVSAAETWFSASDTPGVFAMSVRTTGTRLSTGCSFLSSARMTQPFWAMIP